MLRKIGGTRNGVEWPDVGGVLDVPDHEAVDLIAAGYAERAYEEPRSAVAPPIETEPPGPRRKATRRPTAKRTSDE
jgi:hypothetical protein